MNIIWTIIPILLLVMGTASVVVDQIAWRDFRKRKFSSFEEKQKFRKIIFWGGWGSYKYLSAVRSKKPVLSPYTKILSAIGLLLLIWLFSPNTLFGPTLVITALALGSLYEGYVAIKNRRSSTDHKKAHD